MNEEKTEAMWLGSNKNNETKPLNLRWSKGPIKVLGIYVGHDRISFQGQF